MCSGGKQQDFKNTFGVDASFDIALLAPRAPDAVGKLACATPQGKAMAELLRAARTGDKSALRRVMFADQVKTLAGPDAAKPFEIIKLSPNPKTAGFGRLLLDGNNAVAEFTERSKDGAASRDYKLRLVDGV